MTSEFNVTLAPPLTSKTREVWLPLSLIWLVNADPSMVRFLSSNNSPLVSVIVAPERLLEKLMVSPEVEPKMACRNEPAPLSLAVVTVKLVATATPGRMSSSRNTKQDWAALLHQAHAHGPVEIILLLDAGLVNSIKPLPTKAKCRKLECKRICRCQSA